MSEFVKSQLENGPAQKAARVASQLKELGVQAVRQDVQQVNNTLLSVWARQNEGQLGPAEIVAAFGTDAVELFTGHAAKTQYLLSSYPTALKTLAVPVILSGDPSKFDDVQRAQYQVAMAQVQGAVNAGNTVLLRPAEATVTPAQDGSITVELPA